MPDEGQRLTEIEKLAGVIIEKMDYPDFVPGPIPSDVRSQVESQSKRADPMENLKARTAGRDLSALSEDERKAQFPDGNIPSGAPTGLNGRRVTRRRR
jgi:hypothetical protein